MTEPAFTLVDNTTAESLRGSLKVIGIAEGNLLQQYWRVCMDILSVELYNTSKALVDALNAQDPNQSDPENKYTKSTEEYAKRISEFEDSLSKISWSDSDITLSPSQFYNKFFANCIAASSFIKSSRGGSWRNLYEHIGASSQCKVAQQKINEVMSWNVCYICGEDILDKYSNNEIHDTRECEHILPAFTSLGYKGLIQSSNANNIPDELLDYFKYEYANSHRCCNQVKSDDKWIKYNLKTQKYEIDQTTLENTLINIHMSKQYDCSNIEKLGNQNAFKSSRVTFIVENYLKPILKIINKDKEDFGELFDLNIRINQLLALRPSIGEFAHALLNGQIPTKVSKGCDKTYAKFLAKKQIKNPENIFFEVFKDLTDRINDDAFIEILFSEIFGQQLRKLTRISRKIYEQSGSLLSKMTGSEQPSMFVLKDSVLKENQDNIDNVYGNEENMDEDKIIALNNMYLLKLKGKYREALFYIINKSMEYIKTNYPDQGLKIEKYAQEMNVSFQIEKSNDDVEFSIQTQATLDNSGPPMQLGGINKYKRKKKNDRR